jgi:hypothetical protein
MAQVYKEEWLMVDHHGTFVLFFGSGVVAEQSWSFTQINIQKAILKLRIENVPPAGVASLKIEYFDTKDLTWKEMGFIEKWHGGSAYKEVDVTEICRNNPSTKWRAIVDIFYPWVFFYTCLHSRALLYLEYTGGAPQVQGVTSETPFGPAEMASVAQMMDFMMQFMMMFMMMSLVTSMISAMVGAFGGS